MRLNLATAAPPTSHDNPFRMRRFALCRELVESVLAQAGACRVLDIGGLPDYWRVYGADLVADARVSISLLNLGYPDDNSSEFDWKFERLTGDARNLDGIADKSFDVAHSNSVIEHVGPLARYVCHGWRGAPSRAAALCTDALLGFSDRAA